MSEEKTLEGKATVESIALWIAQNLHAFDQIYIVVRRKKDGSFLTTLTGDLSGTCCAAAILQRHAMKLMDEP